jgi:DNA primase
MTVDLTGIDVMDLMERLEARNARATSGGDEVNFSCFGATHSHGDESPSAYMNLDNTLWFCHGCKMRGSAIQLVMLVQNVAQPTAERWLRETYGIEFNEPMGGSMVAEMDLRFRESAPPVHPTPPPRSWLSSVRVDWSQYDDGDTDEEWVDYILRRGYNFSTLASWDIGYDYLSDRLTIPVFDVDDELVGVKARGWRPDQQPKYLILGDRSATRYGFQPYEASDVVFGLHRATQCKLAVLCEGELNAIALSQMGIERPVATGMSYFSERHARELVQEAEEVVIFYDSDKAGSEGVEGTTAASGKHRAGARELLEPHVRVRVVQEPNGMDPADYLEQNRGGEVRDLIDRAPSALALHSVFG